MNHSLEEERKAILERMDASRRSLRQMLSDEEEHKHPFAANTFPRSHTFKFLIRHPYLVGLAVVAVVAALPRGLLKKAAKGSAAVTADAAPRDEGIGYQSSPALHPAPHAVG